jgi:branched-chain amino acid transport system ATP-binding protein
VNSTSAAAAPCLEVAQLTSGYGETSAIRDISMTVGPGELVGVAGANGAGKSTLLRSLSGIIKPRAGRVMYCGQPVTGWPAHKLARLGLVHVPEGRGIFGGLSVEDNLLTGALRAGSLAVDEIYDLFPHLRDRRRQAAGSLSGGEQQMVALGRGLISRPRLILIDELSLGLAPMLTEDLYERLTSFGRGGRCSMLLVDQNLDLLTRHCDRILILRTGRVVLEQAADEFDDSVTAVDAYLG